MLRLRSRVLSHLLSSSPATSPVSHLRRLISAAAPAVSPNPRSSFAVDDYLKNTFRWTDAEVGMAVSKAPSVLARSKESLQRRSEFLISEVGLEPVYIAQRSEIIGHSLEGRLRPRYYAVKFLKENGLLKHDPSYSTVFKVSEKAFRKKFISPHKEAALHLTEDYDAACKGDVPTNFRFT